MAFPIAAMIAGGAATSQLVGGLLSAQQAAQNNFEMQKRQLAWEKQKFGMETELANSAHQREVADLKAAGINPVLTATGGNGAETPQAGSIGALPDSSGQIMSNSINSAMETAVNGYRINAETNLMKSQAFKENMAGIRELAESKVANKRELETAANTALLKSQRDLVDEQWNKTTHETMLAYYNVQQAAEELQYVKQNAKNKSEILAAEKKLKTAEASLKDKEDYLYYFSYIWNKGMDIGKLATNIFGIGKINSAINAARNLPGMRR